jgi:hypothetical protein
MSRWSTVLLVCLLPLAVGCKKGKITVISATYGAVCGVPTGNHTAFIGAECDGKSRCEYRVDNRHGDPKFGCPKDFEVTWRCAPLAPEKRTSHAATPNEGYAISLSCD